MALRSFGRLAGNCLRRQEDRDPLLDRIEPRPVVGHERPRQRCGDRVPSPISDCARCDGRVRLFELGRRRDAQREPRRRADQHGEKLGVDHLHGTGERPSEGGRGGRTRTFDHRLKRPLLYQLSYQPYLKIWLLLGSLFLVAEEVQKTSPGSMLMQVFLPLFWFRRWIHQGSSGSGLRGR